MYKVFFNDRTVFMNTGDEGLLPENVYYCKVTGYHDFKAAMERFLHDEMHANMYVEVLHDNMLDSFIEKYFIRIEAAGGLVYNNNNDLLCIKRLGKWDLPKGKIDKGETPVQAAIREVEEETGLHNLEVVAFKSTSYHVYRSPHHQNSWVLKPTYWYNMRYSGSETPVPQLSENITEVRWCNKSTIAANTYASMLPLLK